MNALRQNKAACAYPAMLLNGVCASSGGVVMALLQERYGLSYQWSGLLLAMLSVGNLAAGFAAGMLPAHWGQRHTVLMLAGGAALGYGAMILTGSPWALLAAFTLVGVAKGTTLNTRRPRSARSNPSAYLPDISPAAAAAARLSRRMHGSARNA